MGTWEQAQREARTDLDGTVRYSYGEPEDAGMARWQDISRTGAAVSLGRYLRPGREVVLQFESPVSQGTLHVRARVVWCTAAGDGGQYKAGLFVHRDTPEAALAFAGLGHAARGVNRRPAQTVSSKPVWTLFPCRKEQATYKALAQARAV